MIKRIFVLLVIFLLLPVDVRAKDIDLTYENGVYHIILSGNKIKKKIKFVSDNDLITNREAHLKGKSRLTINAGFFDPNNKKTISYISYDGQTIEDPYFNENKLLNPVLRLNMDKIRNRTEFRILECDKGYKYEIVPHTAPIDFMCFMETSAQGGPMLLPELRLEEEFFIVKEGDKIVRESASVLHKTARTLIGLKDDEVHIFIVTEDNPMDIFEARDLCKSYGLEKAMAFDGGSSTSLNYKNIEVFLGKTQNVQTGNEAQELRGRLLKSFMIIKK